MFIKNKKLKRLLSLLITLSLICSSSLLFVSAASGTKYEVESNDTRAQATLTYDDYDNYGKISQYNDKDYWKVKFPNEGFVNFYLGNIPSGCDYEMVVSDYSGTTIWALDLQSGTNHEFVRLHVKANYIYYIWVYSADYSCSTSAYYHMRVKWYPLNYGDFFAYTVDANINNSLGRLETVSAGNGVMDSFAALGFGSSNVYTNLSAASVISYLPYSQFAVLDNHGYPGYISLPTLTTLTKLYAGSNNLGYNDRAISSLTSGSFSNTSLIVFCACYTGSTDNYGNNLIDAAVGKGAISAIGWTNLIYEDQSTPWLDKFFNYCSQGYSIYDAAYEADDWLYGIREKNISAGQDENNLYPMIHRYYGSSRALANAQSTVLSLCY